MGRRKANRNRRTSFASSSRAIRRPLSRPSSYENPRRIFHTDFVTYIPAKRRQTRLVHSVLQNTRTVRRPLIRTVLRDTRATPPASMRRRSPDLPIRSSAWLDLTPWAEFDAPRPTEKQLTRATTCAKRSIRREVLFALSGLNGSGGRGKPKSRERCK